MAAVATAGEYAGGGGGSGGSQGSRTPRVYIPIHERGDPFSANDMRNHPPLGSLSARRPGPGPEASPPAGPPPPATERGPRSAQRTHLREQISVPTDSYAFRVSGNDSAFMKHLKRQERVTTNKLRLMIEMDARNVRKMDEEARRRQRRHARAEERQRQRIEVSKRHINEERQRSENMEAIATETLKQERQAYLENLASTESAAASETRENRREAQLRQARINDRRARESLLRHRLQEQTQVDAEGKIAKYLGKQMRAERVVQERRAAREADLARKKARTDLRMARALATKRQIFDQRQHAVDHLVSERQAREKEKKAAAVKQKEKQVRQRRKHLANRAQKLKLEEEREAAKRRKLELKEARAERALQRRREQLEETVALHQRRRQEREVSWALQQEQLEQAEAERLEQLGARISWEEEKTQLIAEEKQHQAHLHQELRRKQHVLHAELSRLRENMATWNAFDVDAVNQLSEAHAEDLAQTAAAIVPIRGGTAPGATMLRTALRTQAARGASRQSHGSRATASRRSQRSRPRTAADGAGAPVSRGGPPRRARTTTPRYAQNTQSGPTLAGVNWVMRKAGLQAPAEKMATTETVAPYLPGSGDVSATAYSRRRTCGLCSLLFREDCLPGVITKRAIYALRESWGVDVSNVRARNAAANYESVRLCVFCCQFFHQGRRRRRRASLVESPE